MDYERKYKDALGWMQSLYDGLHGATKEDAEHYFPELKESEDERISREITEFLVDFNNGEYERPNENTIDSWLSWLEKQESVKEIVERCKTSWYNEGKIQGQIEGLSDDEKYQQGWHDALEKQGELTQSVTKTSDQDAWSEDDETGLVNTIIMLKGGASLHFVKDDITRGVDWLKSIKQRFVVK